MPQWFVSFEPSTRASTFVGSVKNNLVDLLAHRWQLATITAWAYNKKAFILWLNVPKVTAYVVCLVYSLIPSIHLKSTKF